VTPEIRPENFWHTELKRMDACIFSSFSLVSTEERFLWETYITTQKNVIVLARLMSKSGSSYKDVSLEEGGDWGPKQVYIIVKFADIVDLGNRLSDL
jgi:hypothetical protein